MLSITYQYADDLTEAQPVRVTVSRGGLAFELHAGGLFLPAGVAALEAATDPLVAAGTLLQQWQGEIIGESTSPVKGSDGAWLHRGPLADQAPRPHHR